MASHMSRRRADLLTPGDQVMVSGRAATITDIRLNGSKGRVLHCRDIYGPMPKVEINNDDVLPLIAAAAPEGEVMAG